MFYLTRNTIYPVSQSPNAKLNVGLLTPNKADYVAPANHVFYFFLSYSLFFMKAFSCLSHFAVL